MADTLLKAYQLSGGNGTPNTSHGAQYTVASGQTFKVGDWVYLDSNGQLTIAAAASNDVGNLRTVGRAGMNAAKALAEGRKCPVEWGDGNTYVFPVYHGTAASAVISDADLDVPTTLPLRNQGGIWCLNKENNGTNDRFVILGIHPCNKSGDQYTVVTAKPMDAALLSKGT